MSGAVKRIRCWFGFHGAPFYDTVRLSFKRKLCWDCGRVLEVQDTLTGARYSDEYQLADDKWCDVSEVRGLFHRSTYFRNKPQAVSP